MRLAKRKADGIEHAPSRLLAELPAQRARLSRLTQRLQQGLACHYQELLKLPPEALPFERPFLAGMAYYRDKIISGWILLHFAKAVANEDSLTIARLKVFWAKWHRADKGPGWKSEAFCQRSQSAEENTGDP